MRANILERYFDIQQQLINKFYEALSSSDVKRMRVYASTLQNFPEVRTNTNYIDSVYMFIQIYRALRLV